MTDAISISEMGLINDLNQMQSIANNIANANTTAFKRSVAVSEIFELQMGVIEAGMADDQIVENNSLVPTLKMTEVESQGALSRTGNPLDLAIEGKGFFTIDTPNGIQYTREGSFTLDSMGRLVSDEGYPVMGLNGEIRLLSEELVIDRYGKIYEDNEYITQLRIVEVENYSSMQKLGNGRYQAVNQQEPEIQEYPDLKQGYLEASNVKPLDEMVKMMMTVRHMESTKQVIQGYDQILGEAISTIAEF